MAAIPFRALELGTFATCFTIGEFPGEEKSMVQMVKEPNAARWIAISQIPFRTAKMSGLISVMPALPVPLAKVWTIDGVGEGTRGSSVKRVGTLSELRRRCELERTAIFSIKVFGGKV